MLTQSNILKKYNIRAVKSLGQNFLIDDNMARKIVEAAEISNNDLVIEIGAGTGSMTGIISRQAGWVAAVEIDRRLIPALDDVAGRLPNVKIYNSDILDADIGREIIKNFEDRNYTALKALGNLPYYITTPIIMKLLEDNPGIKTMVFMMQKEVADRINAKPRTKEYGSLTVAVRYYSIIQKIADVPPQCFIPRPSVYSSVLRFDMRSEPAVKVSNRKTFFKVIKAAFGQRRKTLVNALSGSGYFSLDKRQIIEMLGNLGIDTNIRGEALDIMQFAQLSNAVYEKNC